MGEPAVVLTRAPEDNADVAARLRARGLRVIELPCVSVAAVPDPAALGAALGEITAADLLVLTSRHAVDAVALALGERAGVVPVAVVGPATRDRALARGLRVTFMPSRADGDSLGRDLPLPAGTVVLARSDRALADVIDVLRARGARVREVVAYATVTCPPDPAAAREALGPGATLVVASPSALDALLVPLSAREVARARVVAIGPTTAAHVERRLGVRAIVAAWNDIPEVLDARH